MHTNGFTLARSALAGESWLESHSALDGKAIGNELLAPHRCYLQQFNSLKASGVDIHGLAHITGGGVIDNLPRVLPNDMAAKP